MPNPESLDGPGDKVLCATSDLATFADEIEQGQRPWPRRVNVDPERVEQGLAKLVLTLVELLRQLMERQALRRMEAGSLSEEEIERLGQTFQSLAERMSELCQTFGLSAEDLNLDLGPLGDLL